VSDSRLVAALVLVGPVISGLPYSKHFHTRGGRGVPELAASVAEQIAYWSGSDPWFVAPANTAARQRLHALLIANPHNLRLALELEQRPQPPALPRLGHIAVPTLRPSPAPSASFCPASGHVPHLEAPELFNRVVREFLAGVPERPSAA
jgi:pimeloyl-ACP methyl ester carboxylesterase